MQRAGVRAPALQPHAERLQRQVSIVDRTDGPPDDEPRKQAEDRRQVELATLADDELRRVADLPSIRRVGGELAIEHIGRDGLIAIAHRRALEAFPRSRLQAILVHHRVRLLEEVKKWSQKRA
jgi:hypothetical protein